MAAANAQKTNTKLQFFKAFITLRLIKATCVLIANPPSRLRAWVSVFRPQKILRPEEAWFTVFRLQNPSGLKIKLQASFREFSSSSMNGMNGLPEVDK